MSETAVESEVPVTATEDVPTDAKTTEKSSPEKSPSKKETDLASKAFMHLAAGKRHLAVSDFKNAVTDLEEACRILGEIFGEDGDECADGYYYYGLALLDLARQESGVLADLPESESEEDKADDSDGQKEESEKAKIEGEKTGDDVKSHENTDSKSMSNCTITNGGESADQKEKTKVEEGIDEEREVATVTGDGQVKEEQKTEATEVAECSSNGTMEKTEGGNEEAELASKDGANDSMQIDEELESEVRDAVYSALEVTADKKKEDCLVCRVEVAYCNKKLHQEKSGESAEEKAEEQDGDEEKEESEKMEEDEKVEENGKAKENGEEKVEENGKSNEDGEDEKEEENPDEASVEKGTENEQEEEEEDEVSNLQLAWEVLELAKVIFTRRRSEGLEIEKKLSMVYVKLGEVSLESENYPQSIEDLRNCLEIRKKVFPSYHRDIAEVHYQLATALQFDKQYDLAIENYHGAMTVLEDKIKYLNEVIQRRDAKEKGEEVTGDDGSAEREKDAFYTEQDEIKEIEGLFPDLKEKIADTKDLKVEHIKKLAQMSSRMLSGEGPSGSGSSSSFNPSVLGFEDESSSSKPSAASVAAASPTKPAVNISHLVKRKRKAEDEEEPEEKKTKVMNGNSESSVKE